MLHLNAFRYGQIWCLSFLVLFASISGCGDETTKTKVPIFNQDSYQSTPGKDITTQEPAPASCASDVDCTADLPYCAPGTGTCVECLNLGNCAEDQECLDGTCVASGSICIPNKQRCLGKVIQQCAADGMSFIDLETCEFGCANAQCTICQPAQSMCNGSVVDKCELDGSAWVLSEDCEAQGMTCINGKCLELCSADTKLNTNVGCEYWAVDLDNHVEAQDSPFAVIVSNLSLADAMVTITRRLSSDSTEEAIDQKNVPAGALEIFNLPPLHPNGAGVSWSGYHISSTSPIIAYQFNPLENVDVFSNDASMLIPENSFGTEYIVQSRAELQGQGQVPLGMTCAQYCTTISGGSCVPDPSSFFGDEVCLFPFRGTVTVVARYANTQVTVKVTGPTLAGPGFPALGANEENTITLEPYQVLNIKTDGNESDLTGTIITATNPIAVFGGHEAAVTSTECCADHLEQQLFPVSTWGKEYIAAKSYPRGVEKDYWRIVAAEDDTSISFSPAVDSPKTLNRGEWVEISTDQDFVIQSTKAVSVAQILASSQEIISVPIGSPCSMDSACHPGYTCASFGGGCRPPACTVAGSSNGCPGGHTCACFGEGFLEECQCSPTGDPALILMPPAEQFRTEYVFLTPDKYADDYLNIIGPVDAVVTLDNIQVPEASFVTIPGSNYKVARMGVLDGVHNVTSTAPIGVVVYGYDKDVSYGYVAGLNLMEL